MRIISILGVTMRFAAVTSVVLVLTGCSSFFPPASERELGSAGYWLNYDAARRGAVVLKKLPMVTTTRTAQSNHLMLP